MNFNDYKYIISTGCSYGRITSSILSDEESWLDNYDIKFKEDLKKLGIEKYNKKSNNIVYIDIPMPSQGTGWQSDSLIYTIQVLINNGINSENIYALVEWSQWSRGNYTVPQSLHKTLDINNFNKNFHNIGDSKCEEFLFKYPSGYDGDFLKSKLNIKSYKDIGINFTMINGEYYISPLHTSEETLKKILGPEWGYFLELLIKTEDSKSVDEKVKDYLNNILKTQNFLKLNKINYNFFHMQGCMTGWYIDNDIVKHKLTHDSDYQPFIYSGNTIKKNENYKITTSQLNDLYIAWKKYDWIYNQIDFDNIWYYNSGGYRLGGIDEYSLSKYGETSYTSVYDRTLSAIKGNGDSSLIQPAQFGRHPAIIVYKTLWNQVTMNCNFLKYSDEYLELLDKKIFEDINSDDLTQNGLLFSRKHYWNYIK